MACSLPLFTSKPVKHNWGYTFLMKFISIFKPEKIPPLLSTLLEYGKKKDKGKAMQSTFLPYSCVSACQMMAGRLEYSHGTLHQHQAPKMAAQGKCYCPTQLWCAEKAGRGTLHLSGIGRGWCMRTFGGSRPESTRIHPPSVKHLWNTLQSSSKPQNSLSHICCKTAMNNI